VPDADVALWVGVNGGVAGVPEEPNVLLVCDGFGVEEIPIDFGNLCEGRGYWMETWWDWVVHEA
jgi:hypothetical protein